MRSLSEKLFMESLLDTFIESSLENSNDLFIEEKSSIKILLEDAKSELKFNSESDFKLFTKPVNYFPTIGAIIWTVKMAYNSSFWLV